MALFISQKDEYTPPRSAQALAEALQRQLVFFNTYDFSLYGYYDDQNLVSFLDDMVRVMRAYPAARDQ